MEVPAISVIIPVYNAEKYIGDCLDSLLAQTFTDFELIVVDDCSTDNSATVVKSYAEKFGGRLKLTRTKKNSGAPGVPGNIGFAHSRGEYLFFMDNDDAVTPTAFAELYTVAKNFNVDVVICEKYFEIPDKFWNNAAYLRNLEPVEYQRGSFVSKPTLISFDIAERVRDCYNGKFLWPLWTKLIRRDFMIKNDIRFADSIIQDMVATCCMIYTAERFVRVPNIINLYRVIDESVSHPTDKGLEYFRKYVKSLVPAFRHFDNFLNEIEFFRQHPAEKYLALETVWNVGTEYLIPLYGQFPIHEFDKILREEFSDGDNLSLAAFAFNAANAYYRQLIYMRGEVTELQDEIRRLKE